MKTSLYFIRHAEVEETYHRVFGGRIDMGLSQKGHDQAAALAGWLRNRRFDTVYASPMQRVQLTLAPFRQHHPGEPVLLEGLREVDFGAWTGFGWNEVEEKFGMSAFDWLEHMEHDRIHEAEPIEHFRQRVAQSVHYILEHSRGTTAAVFAHGGVIRMALSVLLGLPMRKFEHFEIDYASVSWLDIGELKAGRPRTEIQLLNFTPWRDR
jgi:broad specificity phosphatase PhoE